MFTVITFNVPDNWPFLRLVSGLLSNCGTFSYIFHVTKPVNIHTPYFRYLIIDFETREPNVLKC